MEWYILYMLRHPVFPDPEGLSYIYKLIPDMSFERTFRMQVTPLKKKLIITLSISLVFIIAILLSSALMSKELDLYFPTGGTDYDEVYLDLDDELIEVVSLDKDDQGLYHVRLKAAEGKRKGYTDINLKGARDGFYAPDTYGQSINVTGFGILYSGKFSFNGMHAAFSLLGLLYLCYAILLFKWHREYRKSRFFSYGSIQDLGLAVYFLSQALTYFAMIIFSLMRSEPLSGENLLTINSLALSFICLISFPVIFIFAVMITISNIGLLHKEGKSPSNALGILLSIVLIAGLVIIAFMVMTTPNLFAMDLKDSALVAARGVISSVFFYFVCNLFSTLLHCQLAGCHKPAFDKQYVIILGCGIRDDGTLFPLLQGRADRALSFYHAQEKATGTPPVLVPSGGQGPDECMPEGEAIKNYLISMGIPESQILPETRSVNTLQNMQFSRKVIEDNLKGTKDSNDTFAEKVAFSTTNFHVFRSGILAYDAGMNADGMGAKTKWYFWPNALIREFIGMLVRHWKLHAAILFVIILQAVVSGNAQWIFSLL